MLDNLRPLESRQKFMYILNKAVCVCQLLTPTTHHFLRVNAQMRNLTKQKTDA